MIYRCNNCGRNFNLKPDYCDCGNNTFVEVVENFDYSSVKTDFNAENDVDFLYNNLNTFSEQEESDTYGKELKKQRTSEIVAVIVFVVVLITALIMIFSNLSVLFKKSQDKAPSVEIESYIPSDVNEYWVDSKPDNQKQNVATNSVDTNSVKKNAKSESKSLIKQSDKSLGKSSQKPVVANLTKKDNVQSKKTEQIQKTQSQQKTQIVSKEKPKVVSNQQTSQKTTVKADNTISVEEYLRYKNSLRNKLFANFAVLNVQGQGVAKVAFSLSSDGKLTNRRFVSQSGNRSLDDAMYNMLMRVPAYYPPPDGYDGREIIMQMEFNNGHYSFAYLN